MKLHNFSNKALTNVIYYIPILVLSILLIYTQEIWAACQCGCKAPDAKSCTGLTKKVNSRKTSEVIHIDEEPPPIGQSEHTPLQEVDVSFTEDGEVVATFSDLPDLSKEVCPEKDDTPFQEVDLHDTTEGKVIATFVDLEKHCGCVDNVETCKEDRIILREINVPLRTKNIYGSNSQVLKTNRMNDCRKVELFSTHIAKAYEICKSFNPYSLIQNAQKKLEYITFRLGDFKKDVLFLETALSSHSPEEALNDGSLLETALRKGTAIPLSCDLEEAFRECIYNDIKINSDTKMQHQLNNTMNLVKRICENYTCESCSPFEKSVTILRDEIKNIENDILCLKEAENHFRNYFINHIKTDSNSEIYVIKDNNTLNNTLGNSSILSFLTGVYNHSIGKRWGTSNFDINDSDIAEVIIDKGKIRDLSENLIKVFQNQVIRDFKGDTLNYFKEDFEKIRQEVSKLPKKVNVTSSIWNKGNNFYEPIHKIVLCIVDIQKKLENFNEEEKLFFSNFQHVVEKQAENVEQRLGRKPRNTNEISNSDAEVILKAKYKFLTLTELSNEDQFEIKEKIKKEILDSCNKVVKKEENPANSSIEQLKDFKYLTEGRDKVQAIHSLMLISLDQLLLEENNNHKLKEFYMKEAKITSLKGWDTCNCELKNTLKLDEPRINYLRRTLSVFPLYLQKTKLKFHSLKFKNKADLCSFIKRRIVCNNSDFEECRPSMWCENNIKFSDQIQDKSTTFRNKIAGFYHSNRKPASFVKDFNTFVAGTKILAKSRGQKIGKLPTLKTKYFKVDSEGNVSLKPKFADKIKESFVRIDEACRFLNSKKSLKSFQEYMASR